MAYAYILSYSNGIHTYHLSILLPTILLIAYFSRKQRGYSKDKQRDSYGRTTTKTSRAMHIHTAAIGAPQAEVIFFDVNRGEAEKIKKGLEKRMEHLKIIKERKDETSEKDEIVMLLMEIRDLLKG